LALGEDALLLLEAYDWPGNVREMENLLERLVVLTRGAVIHIDDLPARVRDASARTVAVASVAKDILDGASDFQTAVASFERALIEHALRKAEGNKTRAAEILGLSRTTLLDKMSRFKH
jgi:DNA-binding NtrC family response regulator